MDLILDVKIYIALFDETCWFKMYLMDVLFKDYASTTEGINKYINTFTKTVIDGEVHRSLLNGILHSIHDLPAVITPARKSWYCMGKIQRYNDLPSIISINGDQWWYSGGSKHRDNDLPAHISNNAKCWYYNGLIHRDNDLPAFMNNDINRDAQYWFQHGLQHRDNDLPAQITAEYKKWYCKDKLHRDNNLPAIICTNGVRYFYIHDKLQMDNTM